MNDPYVFEDLLDRLIDNPESGFSDEEFHLVAYRIHAISKEINVLSEISKIMDLEIEYNEQGQEVFCESIKLKD